MHKYLYYLLHQAKRDLHREELFENLLSHIVEYYYQGNGIKESIFQSRRAFAALLLPLAIRSRLRTHC